MKINKKYKIHRVDGFGAVRMERRWAVAGDGKMIACVAVPENHGLPDLVNVKAFQVATTGTKGEGVVQRAVSDSDDVVAGGKPDGVVTHYPPVTDGLVLCESPMWRDANFTPGEADSGQVVHLTLDPNALSLLADALGSPNQVTLSFGVQRLSGARGLAIHIDESRIRVTPEDRNDASFGILSGIVRDV